MQTDPSSLSSQSSTGERRQRNRKRSKRRGIYCPIHTCYLDSVSPKYPLFADQAGQLQQRGISRKHAQLLIADQTAVPLQGEWLEAFWCEHCQKTKWYRVRKRESTYEIAIAPPELWRSVSGVIDPYGNPSVSEFTRRQARMLRYV
ncbi:hypothetical protein [Pantanalinema sp. GBBB05]|uniref:hypothetical protein n=1 Tax=Pantanalinema sp. GBBB05 TaxID=2604139 RepID=UPI001DBFE43C|nr:hypothetical protein [Pantanalinema sp. GBBB05]